jgi:dihydroxyacetone kinase-like protein
MDQRNGGTGQIPVADVLRVIAATLRQERGRLNGLSSFGGDGLHGDRMTRAFADAADAVYGTGTGDAGEELQLAGQVLMDPAGGYGQAARYLGRGLVRGGQQLLGQSAFSLDDLSTFLPAFLEGVQEDNTAQPGDGTLLDVLIPAVTAYSYAAQQRLTYLQATQGLLGAANGGVRRTINMPQLYNRHRSGTPLRSSGYPDPGAASAQTFLTGLVMGLLGNRVPTPPADQPSTNFLLNLLQQGIDLGGGVVTPPRPSPVENMLSGTSFAGNYGQSLVASAPGYGKGTDVKTE